MKEKRIKLKRKLRFQVSMSEKRRLYTALALMKYHYECQPDYNTENLLMRLCRIFNKYNSEIIRLCEAEPNNFVLQDLNNFISRHYGGIKAILKENAKLSKTTTTGDR